MPDPVTSDFGLRTSDFPRDQLGDPFLHLARGLVREGDAQDVARAKSRDRS